MIQLFDYLLQHRLCISQHIVVPESQNPIASFGEKLSPPHVCLYLIDMMPAIQLDDQLRFGTKEVHDVPTDGLLPAELKTVHLSAPKMHPQLPLGIGLIVTEALGAGLKCLERIVGEH